MNTENKATRHALTAPELLRQKPSRIRRAPLLIIAPILSAVFLLVCVWITQPKEIQQTQTAPDTAGQFTQLVPPGAVTPVSVTITAAQERYTLSGREATYTLDGEDAQLSEQAAKSLLACGSSVLARSRIEGDAADFGLSQPVLEAVFTYAEGQTLTLALGNAPPTGSGRYAQVAGDEGIYVVNASLFDQLSAGRSALYALPDFSQTFTAYTLESVTIEQPQQETITIERVTEENPFHTVAQFAAPLNYPANSERTAELFLALAEIKPLRVLAPEGADADYGLATPLADISLVGTEAKTLRLRIGKQGDTLTLRVDEDAAVYALAATAADFLKNTTVTYLAEQLPGLVALSEVSDIALTRGADTYKMRIERTGDEAAYFIGDVQVPSDDFSSLYQGAIGLLIERRIGGDISLQADGLRASFTYTLRDGSTWSLGFLDCGDQYDAVLREGEVAFLISKRKVDAVFDAVAQYMEGQAYE